MLKKHYRPVFACLYPSAFHFQNSYGQEDRVVVAEILSVRITIHSVVRKINVLAFSVRVLLFAL